MSLSDERLTEIANRYDPFPAGVDDDVRDLLAEVHRLREGIERALTSSQVLQREMRASVVLAVLQENILQLIHPYESVWWPLGKTEGDQS